MNWNNGLKVLQDSFEGDIHLDKLHQVLYATDASVYRELPIGVAFPKNASDIQKLVEFATKYKCSLIPRAAGTSLAGQCVGNGLVVDISKYLNAILEINKEEKYVWVEPGVVRDELNEFLEPFGLFFGPNTSTSNRATIGGMMGNNSCGSTSIVYGSTRDHILASEVIFSDGTKTIVNDLTETELYRKARLNSREGAIYSYLNNLLSKRDAQTEIANKYPKSSIKRRNTGYALDLLVSSKPFKEDGPSFNLNKILTGSEGTLAFATKIKLSLDDLPLPHVSVVAIHCHSIRESMEAAVEVMKGNPSACELMDKTILDCTKGQLLYEPYRFFVQDDPKAILLVEYRGDSLREAKHKSNILVESLKNQNIGYHYALINGSETEKVWALRKAGLGLLANIPGDKKAVACIEDTAVAIADLPDYIEEFTDLMKNYNQEAVYYAHAGAGELHLRPVLNLKNSDDVKDFEAISKASMQLVKKYKGSLSGEHGDGRVRAPFIPEFYGEQIHQIFLDLKKTFDPENIFNPGKIVDAKPMSSDLRYKVDKESPKIETIFDFSENDGILKTVEKCNGSGDCRKLSFAGGTMCPSYRATLDERDTTRGRANVLREFLTQSTKENPFDHPEIAEAMSLCISCKGCKSECPSNVDMATLKAEFQYQYHKANGASRRSRILANNASLNALASTVPTLANTISNTKIFKSLLGIANQRKLPKLQKSSLRKFLKSHNQPKFNRSVYLFIDEYTNYYDVELGKKTVQLLNSLGYQVRHIDHEESGRALISKGFLEKAKKVAQKNVTLFHNVITKEIPLIGIEPSAILTFYDEYPKLVDKELSAKANKLKKHVFLIEEFLANEIDKGVLTNDVFNDEENQIQFHGHCHQKALSTTSHSLKILNFPKNYNASEIASGCCGMAGSFGYEKEHYELSMQIGEQSLFPSIRNSEKNVIIAANGTSCRHQIQDGTHKQTLHPVEILFNALIV
ncbi:MAG: FAD-binding and (Fe-S)-binding domain-containing protein [bacterium]